MKKITFVLSFAALILVIGSIGAFDNNDITMLQFLIQFGIGAGIEFFILKNLEGEM